MPWLKQEVKNEMLGVLYSNRDGCEENKKYFLRPL